MVADFTGGEVTSDAGGLLLREVAEGSRILRSFADCFVDHRDPELIEHSVLELVAQRAYAVALGYEDVNDHDELRRDLLVATLVGKAEYLAKGENPRFIVTSLTQAAYTARSLYEELYCARGDMENRIKEQQLDLFADRTSTSLFRSNQLRLWFSSVAYVLLSELRRLGLKGTELERAQCSTIRNKLLKIGALVCVSVRRVWLRLASGYPYKELLASILTNLKRAYQPIRV